MPHDHDRDCCCTICEPGDDYTAAELASFANPDNWPNEHYPNADRFGEDIRQFD